MPNEVKVAGNDVLVNGLLIGTIVGSRAKTPWQRSEGYALRLADGRWFGLCVLREGAPYKAYAYHADAVRAIRHSFATDDWMDHVVDQRTGEVARRPGDERFRFARVAGLARRLCEAVRRDDAAETRALAADPMAAEGPADHALRRGVADHMPPSAALAALLGSGAASAAAKADALLSAVRADNPRQVKALLDGGADASRPTAPGEVPLLARARSPEVAGMLFAAGAPLAAPGAADLLASVLRLMADGRHDRADAAFVDALLRLGADPNGAVEGYRSAHWAAAYDRSPDAGTLRLVLDAGADPNARSDAHPQFPEWTPAHAAVACWSYGDLAARLDALAEAGADLDLADATGLTPLHMVASDRIWPQGTRRSEEQLADLAGMLLARGASPDVETADGRTAADLAEERGMERLAALLRGAAPAARPGPR